MHNTSAHPHTRLLVTLALLTAVGCTAPPPAGDGEAESDSTFRLPETGDECCGGYCRGGVAGTTGLECLSTPPSCTVEYEKCTTDSGCCGHEGGLVQVPRTSCVTICNEAVGWHVACLAEARRSHVPHTHAPDDR
jgi:hypothetical protein